jgi:serine/threonine protein kinase
MAGADQGGRPGSPQIVGRYEILREIGRGGMAIVYVARQPDLDRQVALKELSRFHAGSDEYAHRFLRESRLAGSLNHPNIVTVHEYFEHAGIPYIAMEYVPRGSLRPYMKRLSLSQIGGVLEGVLAGLTYGEAAGIVHRDLKPENIMVTSDGRVKITDFGIARATERAGTQYVTATGMTVGTPTYMAPEQAMAGDVGPWSDLYSVGVLTYELLVGQVPFHDTDSPMAILMRHVNERIPSAIEVRPEMDRGLSEWIDALLVKEPSERVRHALDAWEMLEEIIVRMLGPLWRRNARLLDDQLAAVSARPLTPAPFESHASIQTPTPGPTAAVAEEFVTFEPGRLTLRWRLRPLRRRRRRRPWRLLPRRSSPSQRRSGPNRTWSHPSRTRSCPPPIWARPRPSSSPPRHCQRSNQGSSLTRPHPRLRVRPGSRAPRLKPRPFQLLRPSRPPTAS